MGPRDVLEPPLGTKVVTTHRPKPVHPNTVLMCDPTATMAGGGPNQAASGGRGTELESLVGRAHLFLHLPLPVRGSSPSPPPRGLSHWEAPRAAVTFGGRVSHTAVAVTVHGRDVLRDQVRHRCAQPEHTWCAYRSTCTTQTPCTGTPPQAQQVCAHTPTLCAPSLWPDGWVPLALLGGGRGGR